MAAAKKLRLRYRFRLILSIAVIFIIAAVIFYQCPLRKSAKGKIGSTQNTKISPLLTQRNIGLAVTWLPNYFKIESKLEAVEDMPLIDYPKISNAFGLIEKLANSPFLSTPDDQKIIQLLKEYRTKQRKMPNIQLLKIEYEDGSSSRAAYNCYYDILAIRGDIHPSTEILAQSIYHELYHVNSCVQRMAAYNIKNHEEMAHYPPENDCAEEYGAYGAQIRFLAALNQAGQIPQKVSGGKKESNDLSAMRQTISAFYAIDNNTFCTWLEEHKRNISPEDVPNPLIPLK